MANHYNISDLKRLTQVLGSFYPGYNYNQWPESLKGLIKEKKSLPYRHLIKETLLDLFGFCFGISKGSSNYEKLFNMLFKKPLNDMPLYISSPENRERLIAQWRLSISR